MKSLPKYMLLVLHYLGFKRCKNMCAINDPLGQDHSPASGYHYSHLKFVSFCKTEVQTSRLKIVITSKAVTGGWPRGSIACFMTHQPSPFIFIGVWPFLGKRTSSNKTSSPKNNWTYMININHKQPFLDQRVRLKLIISLGGTKNVYSSFKHNQVCKLVVHNFVGGDVVKNFKK